MTGRSRFFECMLGTITGLCNLIQAKCRAAFGETRQLKAGNIDENGASLFSISEFLATFLQVLEPA